MRKLLLLFAALILVSSCTTKPTATDTFRISGKITNAPAGKIVLTQLKDLNRKELAFVDEIKIDSDGNFDRGFAEPPHVYLLDLFGRQQLTLAISPGETIRIEADGRDLKATKVTGSTGTEKLQAYEKFRRKSLERLVISVRDKLKATNDYNSTDAEEAGMAEVENYEKHRAELDDYIEKNLLDSVALYPTSLRWGGTDDFSRYESFIAAFEKKFGDIEVTKRLKEKIALLKATNVGGTAAGIELPDKDGKKIKLDPASAKITLVDFWASWCGPCRRESKKMRLLYDKYKEDGFDIYSVSLDSERDKWLSASREDGRIWTDVSSLEAYDTPVAFDYAVTSLPAKFLIDSNGKILEKDLLGERLEEKIKEHLK